MQEGSLREYRTFGPPGTGKTTFLARQIEKAAGSKGSQNIIVCSFTKAAVRELNRRNLPIPAENLGTLHALAYRALGMPKLCETPDGFKEFNTAYPEYQLASATMESMDDGKATGEGNDLLSQYAILRTTMTNRALWNDRVRVFANTWEQFKRDTDSVDFTDLIDFALRDIKTHPAAPLIGFFDEAQDFTPMELALVRQWGAGMERIVLCADDDQMIYSFKGAKVEAILNPPLPENNIRILSQSWRVPHRIHEIANNYVQRIPQPWRQPKDYRPREAEGEVRQVPDTYKAPEYLIGEAERYAAGGKTVLFLASCSYMLSPLVKLLREKGVPFSNPWRRRRGDWNPLHRQQRKQSEEYESTATLVAAFAAIQGRELRLWTGGELRQWTKLVQGVINKGTRPIIDNLPPDQLIPVMEMLRFMDMDPAVDAMKGGLPWLMSNLAKKYVSPATYASKVISTHGVDAISREPSIYVGTIHSLKGGEADIVILFPDISPQAVRGENPVFKGIHSSNEPAHHQIVRQFYVGITRARETLVVCSPASKNFATLM